MSMMELDIYRRNDITLFLAGRDEPTASGIPDKGLSTEPHKSLLTF